MNTLHSLIKNTKIALSLDEIYVKLKQFDQIIIVAKKKIQEEKNHYQAKIEFEDVVFNQLIPMIQEFDDNAYSYRQIEYIDLKKQIQDMTSDRYMSNGAIINSGLKNRIMKILSQITGKTYDFPEENLTLGQKDYFRELGFLRERYIQVLWISWEQLKKYDRQKIVYSGELFSWISPSSLDAER